MTITLPGFQETESRAFVIRSHIGGKEEKMKQEESTINVIAEEIENAAEECPVLRAVAMRAVESFEIASEFHFNYDEDDDIVRMIETMYARGEYAQAVDLLRIVFSLCEMNDEAEEISLLYACSNKNAAETFVRNFIMKSSRTAFVNFKKQHKELFS